jgi:hypothetical protein
MGIGRVDLKLKSGNTITLNNINHIPDIRKV